jgi:hypothetical protein
MLRTVEDQMPDTVYFTLPKSDIVMVVIYLFKCPVEWQHISVVNY